MSAAIPATATARKIEDTTAPGETTEAPTLPQAPDALKGKRILHAPFEIAGNMARISRFLRATGVDAVSANYYDTWLDYQCDINLNLNQAPEPVRRDLIADFAEKAINEYDIYHFHFGQSLYPDFQDLPRLKERGKKMVFSFWGSDVRSPEWILYQQAKFMGLNPPRPYVNTVQQYQVLKFINVFADVMIATLGTPRGLFLPGMIDAAEWTLEDKESCRKENKVDKDPNKVYFLHAPSNNWKKGSRFILPLLEECQRDGMPIEILYVHGKPPREARKIYAHADYAVDQVGVGTFGLFGLEMQLWEIPVLVYQTDLFDRIRNNPPVIKITRQNFKDQIARCVEMTRNGEREELGSRARQWVLGHADLTANFDQYLEIYETLAEDRMVPQYVNTAWNGQEYKMNRGAKSDFYTYLKKEQAFQALAMDCPDYDRRLYT